MDLLHEMLEATTLAHPAARAVTDRSGTLSYAQLEHAVEAVASGLIERGLRRGDRVVVWLPKQSEAVVAIFAAMRAGGVAVPVNSVLKAPQVAHILRDCDARLMVTTVGRLSDVVQEVPDLAGLRAVVTVDGIARHEPQQCNVLGWPELLAASTQPAPANIDIDVAAIFYTSGSTGKPRGVVLSHRNLVAGARSVSSYLANTSDDRLLALLSFSFDYGFSQLSTAFAVGASVVIQDYLLPQEVMLTLERERVTGLAAVPPIWIELADMNWPTDVRNSLRYITNSGGTMPRLTLTKLRQALPSTRVYLMYGLTEAFRSTYLPPEEVDQRPDSIGKAIPGAEVLVLRPDGNPCAVGEPGELVHRGALVSLGYWNDPERTAERFRPVPPIAPGRPLPELAVWSGDIVRRDAEGFLYFIGRRDEMIKTSGYRVSPTEIEEEAYATGLVTDVVAIGVPHPRLGQGIVLVASAAHSVPQNLESLLHTLRRRLPRYMVPLKVLWLETLPRNPNGKFDRAALRQELAQLFVGTDDQGSAELVEPDESAG
jgi:acyl-CoA ligase (AMP-forming) (exosortase A-associated)